MGPLDLLDRAASLGVRVVQVADNLPLHYLGAAELEGLSRRAAQLELELEVGTRGIGNGNLDTYLHLAERLGSRILRVIVDAGGHEPDQDEIVHTVGQLVPALERAGVSLAIENHDRLPVETLARVCERVDSANVGICLDTVNSLGSAQGPELVVSVLAPWTVNLHVKDFVIRRAKHTMGLVVEGCPMGEGRLDLPWLLAELVGHGRDPNVILEMWTAPEESVAATIAKEQTWAEQSIAYLRQFISN
jgi:sugar phosphate isomerase/epimerase